MSSRVAAVAARCLRAPAAPVRVLHLGGIEVLPPPVAALGARTKVMAAPQNPRLFSSAAATASKDFYSKGAAPERDALLTAPLTAQPMLLGNRRLVSTQTVVEDAGDATKAALAAAKAVQAAEEAGEAAKAALTAKEAGNAGLAAKEAAKAMKLAKKAMDAAKEVLLKKEDAGSQENFTLLGFLKKVIQWLLNINAAYQAAAALLSVAFLGGLYAFDKIEKAALFQVDDRLLKLTQKTDEQFAKHKSETDEMFEKQKKKDEAFQESMTSAHVQLARDSVSNNHKVQQEMHQFMMLLHKYQKNMAEKGERCKKLEKELQSHLQALAAKMSLLQGQVTILTKRR